MQKTITGKVVNTVKPGKKAYEIWDTEISGLILRIEPTGSMAYYLQYRMSGKRNRLKLGNARAITPFQVRELAKGHLATVYRGEDPKENVRKAQADNYLSFLKDTYKGWLESNLRTGVDTFVTLKQCFPELHKLSLNDIAPFVIEKWRQRRLKEGLKKASLNRQVDDLNACLNRAVEWKLIKENPLKGLKRYKVDNKGKVRYLSAAEETRLRIALDEREEKHRSKRDSANQWRTERGYELFPDLRKQTFAGQLKPAVLLSINTGVRNGELFKLRWENVDFDQKNLTVVAETAKSDTTRHIPLNNEAFHILKSLKKQQKITSIEGHVFADDNGQPFENKRAAFKGLLKNAKIANFRWHDMRHTFASNLVMCGVDLNTVRELLGHADIKMTLRYAHLAPEHKAAAVAKLMAVASR